MQILYLHPHFTYPGGAGKFVLETGERIAKKGHNVIVLAQSGDENIIKDYPHIDFQFIGGPLPNTISHWLNFPKTMKNVRELTKAHSIDVIFPQIFPANYWGFLLKREFQQIPCVWYCHEPSAFVYNTELIAGLRQPMRTLARLSNPAMKMVDKMLIRYSDIIIANSHFTAENIRNTYGRESIVVYPGIDLSKFNPSYIKEDYLLAVARLSKFKRFDSLIKAMKRVECMRLYIVGDGEEKGRLIALSKVEGVSDSVIFLGTLSEEELHRYYANAKAVVVPTYNEPFGIVPLEAMASGTPVIGTASGGLQETILDGITGYFANDMDEMTKKINLLSSDRCSYEELSRGARKHVEQNFSWDRTVDALLNIFENVKKAG